MGKISAVFGRLRRLLPRQGGVWLLLELAAVILLLTVAANYILNYVGSSLVSDAGTVEWEYLYTNTATPPAGQTGESWRVANAFTPMSSEKTGSYLHLRGSIAGTGSESRLILRADHAPMRIAVNGETVYDNHYGKDAYVGNCYNAIVLPAANGDIAVEVSVHLPFSAKLRTELSPNTDTPAFALNAALVLAAVLAVLSVAWIAVTAVVFLMQKKRMGSLMAAALLLLYAVALALPALSRASYLVNFPWLYNLAAAAELLLLTLLTAAAAAAMRNTNKGRIFGLCLGAAASLLPLLSDSPTVFRVTLLAATVLSALPAALLARGCYGLLLWRIQYAHGFFIMLTFLAGLDILCGVLQLTLRYRETFAYCRLIGEFVFLCFIAFVLSARAISGSRSQSVVHKTEVYDRCVSRLVETMQRVLACRTQTEACKTAADGVRDLCGEVLGEECAQQLAFVVAVKAPAGWQPVYQRQLEGPVDYTLIENHCAELQELRSFAGTYFDFIFLQDEAPFLLYHFENIQNGLSRFFTSTMAALHCCMEVVLVHFSADGDPAEKEMESFTKLAADTEMASGNNRDHLECVAYYTGLLLEEMGYPAATCALVSRAAMLHDIGKVAIPSEITNKSGLLSAGEREIIRRHTEYGHALLSVFDGEFMRCAAVIAAQHHERYDGKGYIGLAGDQIDEYARVVTVADAIDALTTKRSYKEAWPLDTVVAYIDSHAGTMYDPAVVAAMHGCIDAINARITEKSR